MKFVLDSKKAKPCAKNLFGLFFEDINHSLDGLLNANLVQNGWFDFPYFTYGEPNVVCKNNNAKFWELGAGAQIDDHHPIHKNRPFCLRVEGSAVFKNQGYDGEGFSKMFIEPGTFEGEFFYTSCADAALEVWLEFDGKPSASARLELKKTSTYKKAQFKLFEKQSGYATLAFKVSAKRARFVGFSLVKDNYFRGKNNYAFGKFRREVVESLSMGAKFLRFPGGCLVEGDVSTDYLYEWEKTIGAEFERVSKPSVWGYLQSNEIGFFEYLCLCEDLGVLPVPVHHVGVICQIRTAVQRGLGTIRLDPKSEEFKKKVTSSVAHLIFFALGDPLSRDGEEREWATKRVNMGHKKPFDLRFIALGNENWGKEYFENFEACLSGIKNYDYCGQPTDLVKKFGLVILSSAGVDINPQDTNPSWKYLNATHHDLVVDEHVYNTPAWFVDNYYRYDHYNKNLSKVFMGEYACHTNANGEGQLGGENNFEAALCESVFMLGMENNPDIVKLSCYAPLLNKIGSTNWVPDLVWFDNLTQKPTPSLAVQKLFMASHGSKVIKLEPQKEEHSVGKIEFLSKDGTLELKNISSLDGAPLKFVKSSEYDNVVLSFHHSVGDELKIFLGKTPTSGFALFADHGHIFYEKRFMGKRMTLEDLGAVQLSSDFKVAFEQNNIKVLDSKNKVVASKDIWTTTEKVFANVTLAKNKVFVKAINISNTAETFDLILDENINIIKIEGVKHTLRASKNNMAECVTAKIKTGEKLLDTLEPRSINLYVFDV